MFMTIAVLSISTDDRRKASANSLKEVGYYLPEIEVILKKDFFQTLLIHSRLLYPNRLPASNFIETPAIGPPFGTLKMSRSLLLIKSGAQRVRHSLQTNCTHVL